MGGSKAVVNLAGRPLISYPLEAMWHALGSVAIVAKVGSELPGVAGVTVWIEPDEPSHPLAGVAYALGLADRRPVMVCALDLPFVTADLIRAIADTDGGDAPAVIASLGDRTQPLLGCYQPEALDPLTAALARPGVPAREAVAALHPILHQVQDPDELFNVNSPDDLLQASAMLDQRRTAGQPLR